MRFEAAQIHFLSDVFDNKHTVAQNMFCIARATYRLVSYLLADN